VKIQEFFNELPRFQHNRQTGTISGVKQKLNRFTTKATLTVAKINRGPYTIEQPMAAFTVAVSIIITPHGCQGLTVLPDEQLSLVKKNIRRQKVNWGGRYIPYEVVDKLAHC
jgi:hypothetical protein